MTTIRAIEARDSSRWRELFTAYGVFYKTSFSDQVLDGVWAWLLNPDHEVNALVATDAADTVIGFALYRAHPDTFTAGQAMYLDDLYVDPESRGAGAATALLEALAVIAGRTGADKVRWITAGDNDRAQRVYDRIAKKADWVTYELDAR